MKGLIISFDVYNGIVTSNVLSIEVLNRKQEVYKDQKLGGDISFI